MAARKRPKRKSPGARTPTGKRAPRKARAADEETSEVLSSISSALNDVFEEVDRFAERIAQELGLREGRVPAAKRRGR